MAIENGSDGSAGEGNTKTSPRRVPSSKHWCFTWFSETGSDGSIFYNFFEKDKFIVGLETCPETGRKHWQGYVEFETKCRPFEKLNGKMSGAHWEKRKGSQEDNIIYCSKEGNFINKGFIIPRKIIEPFAGKEMFKWQADICKMIEKPCEDTRRIYWFWDSKGCCGKTTLAKHICMHYNAIYVSGKGNDIKCAIATWLKEKKELDIAIFAFPRSYEEFVSYDSLESIKDGIFFNGKYESGMCNFNSPHVLIFANFEPDTSKLSKDRWVITDLNPKKTILDDYVVNSSHSDPADLNE